jgi:hypothetical protein
MRRMAAVLIVLAACAAPLKAQDKAPPPTEQLPAPKPLAPAVVEPLPVLVVPSGPYRVSRYQVWQNLAVDGSGRFRPRVITTTYGSYYYYNGMPYPTPSLRPWYYSPDMSGN